MFDFFIFIFTALKCISPTLADFKYTIGFANTAIAFPIFPQFHFIGPTYN